MVDTHCHLDSCKVPDAELIARAREAGLTRIATVGMNGPSIGRALAAAAEYEEVFAIVGRHPHEAEGFGAADLEEIERAAAAPAARAIGETGLDYFRDRAPREPTSAAPSRRSSSWPGAPACPWRSTPGRRRPTRLPCSPSMRPTPR